MKEQFVAVESLTLLLATWFSDFFMPWSQSLSLSCVCRTQRLIPFLTLTIVNQK